MTEEERVIKRIKNHIKNEAYAKMTENTKDETIKHLEELLRQKSDLIENMEKNILDLEKENKKLWEKINEFESACIKIVELMEDK